MATEEQREKRLKLLEDDIGRSLAASEASGELRTARDLTGSRSNRETVDLALRTLIALRRQPAAVERIIGRTFYDDQIDAPTSRPTAE